jgi:hypothetical protein
MRWIGGITLEHGVLDISRAHIVSFMGAFVEGALHPLVCNSTFFQALHLPFFMVRTLSAMCENSGSYQLAFLVCL